MGRHGNGSMYKTDQGWRVQITIPDPLSGKGRRITRRAKTRDEARRILADLRDNAPAAPTATAGQTFADYLTGWITDSLPNTRLADRTKEGYKQQLTWYGIPAAGTVALTEFTPSKAEVWVQRLRATKKRNGEPLAESTVRITFNGAVKALDTAVRDGLIAENPLRKIDRPAAHYSKVPVTSAEEVDAVLAHLQEEDHRLLPLFTFVAFTGVRVGEALALRWDDIDGEHAVIERGGVAHHTTKTKRKRTITLIPEVQKALQTQRRRQAEDRLKMGPGWQDSEGLVFTSGVGSPLNPHNARRELADALKAVGANPARPWHSLRHGLAHRLLKRGVPLHVVSALLGHSGIQITADVYGHVDAAIPVDVLQAALER